MSTLTSIYQTLYYKLSSVFPEFNFKHCGNCYISQSGHKIDSSTGNSQKVYVYRNNPGLIVDYTRGNISIWDYVKNKYGSSVFRTLLAMADMSGIKEATNQNKSNQDYSDNQDHVDMEILRLIWKFAKYHINDNMKYLKEVRKYEVQTIKKMEIGYITSKKSLLYYLITLGFSKTEAIKALNSLHYIGQSHKIVIPFREVDGTITGFIGRSEDDNNQLPKYLYTRGMKKGLLNIHKANSQKPVTLVEGVLDASLASALGIENIVAIGGNMLNQRQINELKQFSVVYLLLDNDQAGISGQKQIIEKLKRHNIWYKCLKLPNGFKDLDEFLIDKQDKKSNISILEINGIEEVGL